MIGWIEVNELKHKKNNWEYALIEYIMWGKQQSEMVDELLCLYEDLCI